MASVSTKKKKRIKKFITWLVVIAIIVAAFIAYSAYSANKMREASLAIYTGDIYTVAKRDVANTVSATGLIESDEDTTKKVYSTLTYKIDEIAVSLGDKVEAGQLLCKYETETLDRAIREKELSMSTAERSAALNLSTAKLNYDTYLAGMNDGTNATLKNAQSTYDSALDKYESAKEDYDEYLAKSDNAEIITLNSAKRALDNAQKTYDDFKKELDEGTNLQLASAKRSLETARDNYEDYKDMVDDDETAELISAAEASDAAYDTWRDATNKLASLKTAYNKAVSAYEEEKNKPAEEQTPGLLETLEIAKDEAEGAVNAQQTVYNKASDALDLADAAYSKAYKSADMQLASYKTTYHNAQDSYDSTVKNLEDTLENYENSLNTAKDNYETAKENVDKQIETYESTLTAAERSLSDAQNALTNAKTTANNQLESYRIAYENAKNNAGTALSDYQLANLYADLEKTTVTAPISGTVTAVYAVEGESASGVMFVIEDTENLVVTSTIKAYDLDKVEEGMKVKIETDASGEDIFYGVIESISPTAVKDATGSVVSTNDAEFETVVRITDKSDRLRIGVSARIEYIVEEKTGVIAVPESAILEDSEGCYVLTVSDDAEGKVMLKRTPVELGMDDGIYTVVTGIDQGARIADNAEHYIALIGQPLSISNIDPSAGVFDFTAMMPMGRM